MTCEETDSHSKSNSVESISRDASGKESRASSMIDHLLIENVDDQLPLLKPPQLNNVHDIGDKVWVCAKDSKAYVKIYLKTKNEHYKAEFTDLSARKQKDIIDKLRSTFTPDSKELLSKLEKYRRPSPVIKNLFKRSYDEESLYQDTKRPMFYYNHASNGGMARPSSNEPQLRPIMMSATPSYSSYNSGNSSYYPDESHQYRNLEAICYSLEEAKRVFTESLIAMQHENQMLKQENHNLSMEIKKMMEHKESKLQQSNTDDSSNLAFEEIMSKYLPDLQSKIEELIHRIFHELKS